MPGSDPWLVAQQPRDGHDEKRACSQVPEAKHFPVAFLGPIAPHSIWKELSSPFGLSRATDIAYIDQARDDAMMNRLHEVACMSERGCQGARVG